MLKASKRSLKQKFDGTIFDIWSQSYYFRHVWDKKLSRYKVGNELLHNKTYYLCEPSLELIMGESNTKYAFVTDTRYFSATKNIIDEYARRINRKFANNWHENDDTFTYETFLAYPGTTNSLQQRFGPRKIKSLLLSGFYPLWERTRLLNLKELATKFVTLTFEKITIEADVIFILFKGSFCLLLIALVLLSIEIVSFTMVIYIKN